MIPVPFDYVRAGSLDEALERIANDDNAKVIAGGQSLLPLMRWRLAQPGLLVDIGRLDELKAIRTDGDDLVMGGATTYRALLDSADVQGGWPVLIEVTRTIADVQVRNVGTVGGGLAHADPASDMPAPMIALDATFTLAASMRGARTVAAREFFKGPFETALEPDELITEIRIPKMAGSAAYVGFEQPASGFAIAAALVVIGREGSTIASAAVAFTGLSGAAFLASGTDALVGTAAEEGVVTQVLRAAVADVDANEDVHASATFRKHLAAVAGRRAVKKAWERAD